MKVLRKGERNGLVAALKADVSTRILTTSDKALALAEMREKIIPVILSIYGAESAASILKEVERVMETVEPEEERVALISVEAGDIFIANYDFENIGATINDGDVIVVISTGYNLEIGVATDVHGAKCGAYIDRWTLEENALVSNCTKHVEPGKETKVAASVRKEPIFRRMNKKQFLVALSEH